MNKLIFDENDRPDGGRGEYVDEDGGGNVGRVGVVGRSISIRRRRLRLDDVEAAEEDLDSAGRESKGDRSIFTPFPIFNPNPFVLGGGTKPRFDISLSGLSTSNSGVLASPPLTALACPIAVFEFGMSRAALPGASNNTLGGERTRYFGFKPVD